MGSAVMLNHAAMRGRKSTDRSVVVSRQHCLFGVGSLSPSRRCVQVVHSQRNYVPVTYRVFCAHKTEAIKERPVWKGCGNQVPTQFIMSTNGTHTYGK